MVTLENIIEMANQLTDEQQQTLFDLFKQRIIDRRRQEIARDAQITLEDYRAGNLKPMTAEEAIADLRQYLNSDTEE
jgi:uncharacterized protein (DUF305 family)